MARNKWWKKQTRKITQAAILRRPNTATSKNTTYPNMPMPKEKESHLVSEKDSERIKCLYCGDKAYICLHDEWNTGNRKGISFWYFCKAHRKGLWHGKPIPL